MTDARAVALSVLMAVEKGELSDAALDRMLPPGMDKRDKALATELVYGTLERQPQLDFWLAPFAGKPLKRLDAPVRAILRMTAYQMLFLDRVPDFAAVNEAVRLAGRLCPRARSYVNGLLRAFGRAKDSLPKTKPWSMSDGLEKLLKEQYGEEMLYRFSHRPPLQLCVNTTRATVEQVCEETGAVPSAIPDIMGIVELAGGAPPELPGFKEGHFFVEGAASAKAVAALDPRPGQSVLDLCAAPGGKSFAAALRMKGMGRIVSRDLTAEKVSRIKEGAARLGFDLIETAVADATVYEAVLDASFDCIICDVPCSGLGVMAKKPEIRLKNPEDFAGLPALQLAILQNGAKYLKKGGRLLYSTCTLNRAENEAVTAAFLAENDDYFVLSQETLLPAADMDGFYCCVMTRR
ncbi:MAG TPA: 16S rRNA (cytosine(967)-C(5))-methyltransferase RsmB [Terriglobales bacterium]|nr:16S rRNA (cytosine(967)-C(5))-methyltransferase RsmB [Terriglobales bacterium]